MLNKWLLFTCSLISFVISVTPASAQSGKWTIDTPRFTKSLGALYPGYAVTISARGNLETTFGHRECKVNTYHPQGATDKQLQERALNYARTLFSETNSTHLIITFYEPRNTNKFAIVSFDRRTFDQIAKGNLSYTPRVFHGETNPLLADGPLKLQRSDLLKQIEALRTRRANVQQCTAAFWLMETGVRAGKTEREVSSQLRQVKAMVAQLEQQLLYQSMPSAHDMLNPSQPTSNPKPAISPAAQPTQGGRYPAIQPGQQQQFPPGSNPFQGLFGQ